MLKDSFGEFYSSLKLDQTVPLDVPILPLKSFLTADTVADNPWRDVSQVLRAEDIPLPEFEHAQPVSAIRDRDLKELSDWFDREDVAEIEEDLNRHLLMLFPEPCWEDQISEFL
jgi:hypothetical protein